MERDQASLRRRLEILNLPVVPLRRHGLVKPTYYTDWQGPPSAVGIGPYGEAVTVWPHRHDPGRVQVTTHTGDDGPVNAVELETALGVSFVQPLPDGHLLLAASRTPRGGAPNAEVWGSGGELVRVGHLGDAIEHLLTTPSGRVWCGYFDEAMSGPGPQTHGLVRYAPDLTPEWLYPTDAGLPDIFDCYTLNVDGENAHCCPYPNFHLLSVVDDMVTDHGGPPHRSAYGLLREGARGALVGGPLVRYDLVTPFELGGDGVVPLGVPGRIVLPDGLETHRLRYTCRGGELHAFSGGTWYRLTLTEILAATS